MKVFTESIISEMKPTDSKPSNALCIVEGPCMCFGPTPNRNNRIYSRKLVEDRILNNAAVKEALENRSMLGEGGHPENRVDISYPEVGIACEKLWIPEGGGDKLWGRFAILDTPVGRILTTLVHYGTKLGISARAVADSVQRDGHEVILENSYELITFDAVPEPGFKCARLEKVESISKPIEKMTTKELKESSAALKSFKNPVFESRIRILDKEICKRENKIDLTALLESLDRISAALDKPDNKLNHIKYEKQLTSLISEAKDIIKEARSTADTKSANESKIVQTQKQSISIKCNDDASINKFSTETQLNESINVAKLFSNDNNSLLERMCSKFRRNIYE